MAHIPKEAHIMAYYLAKFPDSYSRISLDMNKTKLLTHYSRFFLMPDSSLKRLRDEYDAFFPHRAGYNGAEKRVSRLKIHNELDCLNENELHDKVSNIISEIPIDLTETEVEYNDILWEGRRVEVQVSKYERNSYARKACIKHHGLKCKCCLYDMSELYGEIASGIIEVHHVTPISRVGENYQIDPINDLVPLCPNCHRVVHKRNPPFSIEEVKQAIKNITNASTRFANLP